MAQSMLVTMWNIGVAGGGAIGGALLARLGARSPTWAVLALLVPSAVAVVRAKGHAFPSSAVRAARESIGTTRGRPEGGRRGRAGRRHAPAAGYRPPATRSTAPVV